jgi:CRP-like cAMP-binding protein
MRPVNKLLSELSDKAYARVGPKLEHVQLDRKQVLYRPHDRIDRVYFPENAVVALMTVMEDGSTLETATVGFEGASWISAQIGAESMPCQTIVIIEGLAHTIAVEELAREVAENEHFSELLTQYSHALLIHSMRMTGCTGLHSLQQRCARWILTTLDRVSEERFVVTHEFLAMLLGCRRPSLSLVIEDFKRRGVLADTRSGITVNNRDALLEVSCECYGIIKDNYEQVGRRGLTNQ